MLPLSLRRLTLMPALALSLGGSLYAADAPAPAKEAAPVKEAAPAEEPKDNFGPTIQEKLGDTGLWKFYGHLEQGFTYNPDRPESRQNFGRLFDDRSNDYRLNQLMLTVDKVFDDKHMDTFQWGFRGQVMYGSDARFTHYLGIDDRMDNNDIQFSLVELWANFHLPVLTAGGVDIKAGHFVTLMGAEVIDATGNPLYSHSYIFNWGIPLDHTGFLATLHLTDNIDLIGGLVTGINTGWHDNNYDKVAFHGGIGTKFLDGKLTNLTSVLASCAENPTSYGGQDSRVIVDSVFTWQLTDKLKMMTDLNWGKDWGGIAVGTGSESVDAEWYGAAQYFIYEINKKLSVVFRGEIFRDDDSFTVAQFAENDDFIDLERGRGTNDLDFWTYGGGDTTYYALTLGLNIKPKDNIVIRPEVRWDWADTGRSGVAPFDDASDHDQFTLGFDVIWSF